VLTEAQHARIDADGFELTRERHVALDVDQPIGHVVGGRRREFGDVLGGPGDVLGCGTVEDAVVIDCVFGGPFRAALKCVAPWGTVIVVGLTAGTQVTLDFYELYARRVISYAAPFVPRAERQRGFDALAAHVVAGRISPSASVSRRSNTRGPSWARALTGSC
jgi:threonine dehydrogenase-like Zn-dependent dehydrogenase